MTPASSLLRPLFASLTDPRSPPGRRHPLPAVLGLIAVAALRGARSPEAIARSARDRGPALARPLGFTRRGAPRKATRSDPLRRLDVDALERAPAARAGAGRGDAPEVAVDGKAPRGSADGAVPGVHPPAACAPRPGGALARLRADARTDEHKAAPEPLGLPPLGGAAVTADAMFARADRAAAVLDGGGDHPRPAKDNRPRLRADVAPAFEAPGGLSPPAAAPAGGRSAVGALVRSGARPPRGAVAGLDDDPGRVLRPAGPGPGVPADPRADRRGGGDDRGGLRDHRPAARPRRRATAAAPERARHRRSRRASANAAPRRPGAMNPKGIAAATRHLAAKPFKAIRLVRPRPEN